LKIDPEDHDAVERYVKHADNRRLKNLNNLLEHTALEYIDIDPDRYSIVVSAASLAKKKVMVRRAEPELRDEYEKLLVQIISHTTASLSENAGTNAKKLLAELPRPFNDPPAPNAQAGLSVLTPYDTGGAAAAPSTPFRDPRNSPSRTLQPILQHPGTNDTYMSMVSPTSNPSSPCSDVYPLMTIPSSSNHLSPASE
jgi:hypothetical protein